MLGTSNYVNWSRRNPKRSAQCVSHTGTLVYSTARAGISCIKKEGPIKNSSVIRWTFFQSLSTSSRKDDFMDIDMVKSGETGNTLWSTNWRKDARKSISKESMIDLCEIQNSLIEWLKIIKTKNFVDDGMLLRMKITLTIWPHKNIVSIRQMVAPFERARFQYYASDPKTWFQTSIVYLAAIESKRRSSKKSTIGHRVLLLDGGVGKVLGWTPYPYESHDGDAPSTDWTWRLVIQVFGTILQGMIFSWIQFILLQMDRLQLTAVYCSRREVSRQTPQMTRFRDAKVCHNWLQIRIDDQSIQSDYKYRSGLKVRFQ